jgi:predicted lipoprotein
MLLLLGALPLLGGTSVLGFQACTIEPDKPNTARQAVLRDSAALMLRSHDDLQATTTALVPALAAFEATPTLDTLHAAQTAYRAARSVWHRAQAFYIGPTQDIRVTGETIDSWPVAAERIDALIAGQGALDLTAVTSIGASMRGFPGIEYGLFDSSVSDEELLMRLAEPGLGERRRALLKSQAQDLADKCTKLRDAWAGDAGYAHELGEAGLDSKVFERQRDGVDEVVTGMLYLAELMVMNKLAKPLGTDSNGAIHPEYEEAPRSDGTIDALRDNLMGLKALYVCQDTHASGHSLSEIVRSTNADADARFLASLDAAIASVDAIPPPFRLALVGDAMPIQNAYQAARAVKNGIVMEVAGALGASLGFGYSDTD